MSVTIDGSNGITFSDGSVQSYAASPYVLKNRIINGAMVIDQRNNGASVSLTGSLYTVDRWIYAADSASHFTFQQNYGSVTPPAGFSNYAGFYVSSAYTPSGNQISVYQQAIEGFNFADMAWGTANAQTITLSFWVYSSLTGTFSGAFRNSATTRSYPFSYTISSANTWTKISVTIPGDTSGTWVGATNGVGVYLDFDLGSANGAYRGTSGAWATTTGNGYIGVTGSVQVVATAGATWYITGVQLEIGSTATPFERRLYTTELQLCQRYYYRIRSSVNYGLIGWGQGLTTSIVRANIPLPVTMRVAATGFDYSAANTYLLVSGSNNPTISSIDTSTNSNLQYAQVQITTSTLAVVGAAYDLFANSSAAAYVGVIAEL